MSEVAAINLNAIEIDPFGRVVLSDADLIELETRSTANATAGGVINSSVCTGTNASRCSNQGDCTGTTNGSNCSNATTCAIAGTDS